MPYGYCLQERFGRYVLTQIDYRNKMKSRGWNYKVDLKNESGYRFTNACFKVFGHDHGWGTSECSKEGKWLLVNSMNGKRCVYLHDRDQMVSIVTLLNLSV